MTQPPDPTQSPNTVPWPPLIVVGLAAAALLLGHTMPVHASVLAIPSVRLIGAGLVCAALGLDAAAVLTMRRHYANVLPHRAATALVTTGPFAWSRNPIYLGNTLLLAGAGLLLRNPWFLASCVVGILAVTRLAIVREEAHLAARFGEAWLDYVRSTPRWARLPWASSR